jgi:hypothetical protein
LYWFVELLTINVELPTLSSTLPRYIIEAPTYSDLKLKSGEPKSYALFVSGINDCLTIPSKVPVAPVGPRMPVGPSAPVDPVWPVIPVAPVAPVGPVMPVGPVAPVVPVFAAVPGNP